MKILVACEESQAVTIELRKLGLFRGKRIDTGEWVYGFYGHKPNGNGVEEHFIMEWFLHTTSDSIYTYFQDVPVIPETVGQYTGLKDTNGVEICEGDIVVQDGYIWFDEGKPNYRGTVEWIYSQWQVIAHCVNPDNRGISDGMNYGLNDEGFDEGENSDWEVIGNIYDNPELLRGRE